MINKRLIARASDAINAVTNYILFRKSGAAPTFHEGRPMVAVYMTTLFSNRTYIMDFGTFISKFTQQLLDQVLNRVLIPDISIDIGNKIEGHDSETTIIKVPAWAVARIGMDAVGIVRRIDMLSKLLSKVSTNPEDELDGQSNSTTEETKTRTLH
jgi:hypothetical protein